MAAHVAHANRAAHRELIRRGVGALRRATLWWAVSIAAFAAINLAFWPSLEGSDALRELENMSDDVLQAFGAAGLATPSGYLDGQLFALMLPLLLSGMVIAGVTAITSGDEDAGRLELLHVLPVRRRSLWLCRLAAALVSLVIVSAVTALLVAISLPLLSFDGVAVGSVLAATAACTALAGFHGAVAFAAGAAGLSRGRCVALSVTFLVSGYVLDFVLPIADRLRWARRWSPWWWAIGEQPVTDGVRWAWLGLLVILAAVVVVLGLVRLEHRDIRSA